MGLFRKIKSTFCCYSSKYLLDDDDDDATVVDEENERQTLLHTEEEVSEKPLLSDSDAAALAPYLTSQAVVVKSVLRRRRSTQNTTAGDTPQRRYNVLLFGDSLTAGWCGEDGYGEYHPYGLRIQKRFEEEGLDVEVTVSGVPGECCAHMEERLKRELEQPGKWYDWVIILGGINDVFQGYSAWDIFESLKKLYALCSKHGARVLGITIPEFDLEEANKLDYQRRIVNEHLNVLNNSTTRNTYTLFLLDKFLPMHSLTPEQRKFYWNEDGMHPTEGGYDLMGDMIFDVIYKEGKWN